MRYYELKYLVTEAFYEDILIENYTIGQTANRSFVEFARPSNESDINFVIVTSTILTRVATHEPAKLKSFLEKYDKMLEILKKIDLDDYLNEDEKEDILYDIGILKECFEKYVKKE